jgi:carbon monoxide dehydrogenase subunit G
VEFDNSFEVPLPPGEAWPLLMDIRRIAPCMPGAELTEVVDDKTYKGKIAVRLGPVALAFAGVITFEQLDNANHRARVAAQGSDAKGRGGANASASFRLEPTAGGCKVLVHTDLALSGAVAQYGRGVGMIQATAAQIMGQFAKNLGAMVAQQGGAAASAPPVAGPTEHAALPAGPPAAPAPHASLPQPPLQPADPAPPPAAKPISGFSLMAKVLWDRIVRLFRNADHQKP